MIDEVVKYLKLDLITPSTIITNVEIKSFEIVSRPELKTKTHFFRATRLSFSRMKKGADEAFNSLSIESY